ncbi:hypothetical protein LX69_01587 [Breznakibacter xylanolyticus]|uniref:Uncharacterized protein n=2 Tax=Breznakibacter xylanolyticus TaxID=990 RepID=A0A2W7P1E3_9BACT|nr:hypothetical protein LX69_01587 [Breznakibacter xylanolyticus]
MKNMIRHSFGRFMSFSAKDSLIYLSSSHRTVLLFACLFCIQMASGAIINSTPSGGNWNVGTTWEGGVIPTLSDDVVIVSGATVTINQSVTCLNLTVSGVLNTDNTNRSVTVNGNLWINGSFDMVSCNPLDVLGTTTVFGSLVDTNNYGSAVFQGILTINAGGEFSTANNSPCTFRNGIINDGTFSKSGTGAVTFSGNPQSISGSNALTIAGAVTSSVALTIDAPVTFSGATTFNGTTVVNAVSTFTGASINNGEMTVNAVSAFISTFRANENVVLNSAVNFNSTVTIADAKSIRNNSQSLVVGVLNGLGSSSKWKNETGSTLEYRSGTVPMDIGLLDATSANNTVYYNVDANQTIKAVDYYHLQTGTNGGTANRSKTIESLVGNINIGGNLQIGNRSVFYLGLGTKNISVAGNVTIESSTTWLRTNNTDNAIHRLTIGGVLVTNGGEVRLRYDNATRYCDLTMTGSGDLIQGTGSVFILRNLTLTNVASKTVSYSGNIDFYSGADDNVFTNDGGDFTASAGAFRFMDAFTVAGTGNITFNNLQCGNSNQTIQTLGRDVTVNGILTLNHNNTTSSYLNLNGKALTVIGGYTLTNSGNFGGSSSSNLILGAGNTPTVSGNILFESGVAELASLTHHVVNGSSFYNLGNALSVADLNVISGQLNNASNLTITNSLQNNGVYNQTAGTTYFNKPSGTVQVSGAGINTIQTCSITDGTVEVAADVSILAGFVNNSNEAASYNQTSGSTSFSSSGAQSIHTGTGAGSVVFYNLNINNGNTKTLSRNVDVSNHLTIADNTTFSLGTVPTVLNIGGDLTVDGILNFGGTLVKTVNLGGDLKDVSGTIAMTGTGLAHVLNLNGANNAISTFSTTVSSGSIVNYGRSGDQSIFESANYQKLSFSGSGIKSFQSITSANDEFAVNGTAIVGLNGKTVNSLGNVSIASGATLHVNEGAQLLMASGKILTNNGTFKVVGLSGTPAVVSRYGATGGYSIVQNNSTATFYANQYEFDYLLSGISISDGTIDNTDNFSNGVFSNGSGAQYLQLTGSDLSGLPSVTNVTFNSGPTANVTRTSGIGAITFDNAQGVLAGENFDNDNGNPGTLILWNYPASVYYSVGDVSAGLTSSWSKNPDGSGGNPTSVTDGLNTLIVQDGHSVIVDNNGNVDVKNLIVGQGTSGSVIIGANASQQTVTIRENMEVKGGATLTAGSAGSPSHKLLVYGNMYNDGQINLKPSSGIVVNTELYGIMVMSGLNAPLFNDLTFKTGASATTETELDVNGNLTIETGAVFDDGGLVHHVAGNWSVVGTGAYMASGTIVFDGMVNTINDHPNATSLTFHNLTFSGGGAGSLQENVIVNGDLLVSNNTILQTALGVTYFGDLNIDSGSSYTQTAGVATFAGVNVQEIQLDGTNSFNAVTFSNGGSNAKNIIGNMSVANVLTVSNGATISGNGTHTVTGGVRIDGICDLSGTLIMKGGSLTTGNTSNQILLGTAELRIDGNVYLTVTSPATSLNLIMDNNLVVQNGYLVISNNTQVTGSASSQLRVDAARSLYIRGNNNFPTGFGSYDLSLTSTVIYDAAMDQTVRGGMTYGNVSLGGASGYRKTVDGSLDINGNLALASGSILDLQSFTHYLAGNISSNANSSIDGTNAIFTLDADDANQTISSNGTGYYRFHDLNIVQNGATANRTKNFATGCSIELFNDFNITNSSGSASIMLVVVLNDNGIGGTPGDWNLGEYCQLQTTSADFYTGFTSKFSGTKNLDVNSSVYYILNGSQIVANGFTYGNLTFNGGDKTARGALDINGTISRTAGNPVFYDGGFIHTVAGDWNLNSTAYYTVASATGTIVFDGIDQSLYGANFNNVVVANSGTLSVTSSTLTLFGSLTVESGSGLVLDTKNLNIGGDFTVNGSGVFTQSTGTSTFNGSAVQTIRSNASSSFGALTINKPNAVGLQTVQLLTDMIVNGTISITQDAGVLDITNQEVTVSGSIYLYPNSVETADVLIATGSTLVLNGVDAQNIRNRNPNSLNLGNVLFSGAGDKVVYYDVLGSPLVNINGDWTISGSTVDGYNSEIHVRGNWANNGTFQHGGGHTVHFDGADQTISASTFRNLVFSGTDTKTLLGNITANGNVTLSAATLDANQQTITLTGNWDNSAVDAVFVPRTGNVIFAGGNQNVYTGTSSGSLVGKGFYNFDVNATNTVALQGDLVVANDLTVATGTFTTNAYDIWVAGNFSVAGTFSHNNTNSILTLNGSGGTKVFNANNATLRGVVVNAPGTIYLVEGNFGIQAVDMEVLAGEFYLNKHALTVNNNNRKININGGTLVVDESSTITFVGSGQGINLNSGVLKVVGTSTNYAYLESVSNTFALNQMGGTLHMSNYFLQNARIAITGGVIDATDNFSDGTFSGTVTTGAYLTLSGFDFDDFSVNNVTFNSGAANNIVRITGSGTITIEDASGAKAGEAFETDNGVPGTLIEWTYPAGFFWDNDSGDNNWHNPLNWSGNALPGSDDIVYLNHDYLSSDYTVYINSADATVKRVMMDTQGGSGIGLTLVNGYDLTLVEHLSIGSANATLTQSDASSLLYVGKNWTNLGTFNHGNSTVVFNGTGGESTIFTGGTGVGKDFYKLIIDADGANYNLGAATTVLNDLTITQGQLSAAATANVLNVGGNWFIDADAGGAFDPSTSIVTFNGADQSITNGTFYNFVTAGSGTKSILSNIKASYNLTIGSRTTIDAGQYNILVSRYWINNGGSLFQNGLGSVIFDGTTAQQIDAGSASTSFHNMDFRNSGSKTFMRDVNTTGSVVVNPGSGIVYLSTYQLAGVGSDNTFTNNATVYVQGANNFPAGFETIDMASTSRVNYYADIAQSVFPTKYGHIGFGRATNGVLTTKTALGDFEVFGNMFFTDGTTTLDMATNDASVNLTGTISMTAGSTIYWGTGDNATLTHVGGDWYISSNLTGFNHLILAGTGDKYTNGDLSITGNVIVKQGVDLMMYSTGGSVNYRTMTSDNTGYFMVEAGARVFNSRPATEGVAIPVGFDSYQLDAASTYYMYSPVGVDQTLYTGSGIEYGNLYFRNVKNVSSDGVADLVVKGDFDVDASTYIDGSKNMRISGSNIYLTGYTPSSENVTMTLDALGNQYIRDDVDNSLVMPAMIFSGSGTKTIGDGNDVCYIEGNVMIDSNVTATTGRNVTFNGTQWINNGVYSHTANTLTFNGSSDVTIKSGSTSASNFFYNVAFNNASTKTFITDGADINGSFIINEGNVDLGSLTHTIYGSLINTLGGNLLSSDANIVLDGGSQNINTPSFAVNNITMNGSGTKRMFSDWTINGNLLVNPGVTFNTSDNVVPTYYNILVKGNWINNGTFAANTSTVNFEGTASTIDITSGGSNFYNVNFASGVTLYRLQSALTRISRSMSIGSGSELTLNAKTLILGSNIASGKVFTIDGTLRVNENAVLKINNQSSQSQINVNGAFFIVGTDATNVATLTRETTGVAGSETQINVLAGATFGARYYLIEYLQDAGMNLLAGSVLHPINNLSDGAFQNIRNAANVRYLNLESDYSGGVISNIVFNYSGTPVQGTHYNVWRQNAATPIVFDLVGGSLGNYKYERDEEALSSASSGLLQWPAITETNWTGAMNTDWHEAGNWDNGVPSATLDAVIPDRANDPIISIGDAICKKMTITTGTLILDNNRNLSIAGDIEIGTGTSTGILSVSGASSVISVGGSWTRGVNSIYLPGTSSVVFNSSAGTANITPRTSRFYNVEFNNASTTYYLVGSSIGIDGDWYILNGNVTPSTTNYVYDLKGDFVCTNGSFNATAVTGGTINLIGTTDQTVSNAMFNNLNVAGGGIKYFENDISIAGNSVVYSTMSATTGCVVDFNGNVLIDASGTFVDGNGVHTFGGATWTGTGAYSGSGTIVFDRAGDQALNAGSFYNLTINGNGGVFNLNSDVVVNNNMTVVNGINYADLKTYTVTNPNGVGTFSLDNGEAVYVRGTNNFPKGFGVYALGETSFVYYYGALDQIIDGVSYGNLILNNAFEKVLGGNTEVKGNLTFNNATLDVSSSNYSLTVGGTWNNNSTGHFICREGTVIYNGVSSNQSINVGASNANDYYNLTVSKGSGYVAVNNNTANDFVVLNNLLVSGGQFHANGRTITVGGDFVASNAGSFYSNTGTYYLNKASGEGSLGTNGSSLLNMTINSGAIYTVIDNLTLIGDFRLEAGQLNGNGKDVILGNGSNDVAVISGIYKVGAGGTLMIGDGTSLTVTSLGRIEVVGSPSAMATVTHNSTGRYNFVVDGTIAAKYYLFEYMSNAGVYLSSTSSIDVVNNFSEGTFTNGTTSGPMLRIENSQSFVAPDYIANVIFPVNPGSGGYNVAKTISSSGTLEFYNSTGVFTGESYDNDPGDLINWTGPVKLTWNGSVSSNWNNANNWTANYGPSIVPSGDEDVVIATAVNQPILTTLGQKTKNLTINSGASILVNTPYDGGDVDLDVNGDITINGTLYLMSINDNVTVEGNWTRGTTGSVTLNGNIKFDGAGGARVINNRGSNFNRLIISGTSQYQLGFATTVRENLIIENGSYFDVSASNYALTVYGNWLNSGSFNSRTGKVTLLGSHVTGVLNGGASAFYDIDINASSNTYTLSSDFEVKRALYLISGTLNANGYSLNMGDSNGIDDLTITGSLNLNGGAVLNMGNLSRVNVNSGGSLSLVGTSNTNRAVVTSLSGGRYALRINSGAYLAARYYEISNTDAQGLNILSGANIDAVNNLSDGYFMNGYPASGTYITLLADQGDEFVVNNLIFDAGTLNNVTRTSGTTVFYFIDASGDLSGYLYENDIESPDATSGLIRWSILDLYTWLGLSNDWSVASNWYNGVLPDEFANVKIPFGSPYYPVVNDGDLAVANDVTMASGTFLTLNAGARMTVNGNVINDGATILIKNSAATATDPASFLTHGTVTAPVSIEWTYPLGAYIYIGHGVDNALKSNYGSALLYRIVNGGWVPVGVSPDAFNTTSLEGYAVGFPSSLGIPQSVTNTGMLHTSDYSMPIGNNWYLVANPYPTYLDLESSGLNLGDALNTVYTTIRGAGTTSYATYNIESNVGVNTGTQYVAPGQSFWIRNYTPSSTLSINKTVRVHATGVLKSANTTDDVFRIKLIRSSVSDEQAILFRSIGDEAFSAVYDSEKKMDNNAYEISLFTMKSGRKIAINALPELADDRVVPLYMNVGSSVTGSYTLQATNINQFMPGSAVYLKDMVSGEIFDLRENPEYTFTVEGALANEKRFELSFAPLKSVVDDSSQSTAVEDDTSDGIRLMAYGIGRKAVVSVSDVSFEGSVAIEVIDAMGKVYQQVTSSLQRTEVDAPYNTQFFLVKVTYKDCVHTFKIVAHHDEQ